MKKDPVPGPARRASDRGRHGRLSRERVLAAALELVDRDGLSALSMRRLGAELGVEAMALYRYAAGKDALLDGLVEALYLELEDRLADTAAPAPSPGSGKPEWRADLQRIALMTYEVCLAHPEVVPLIATRMMAVPLARRPLAVLRNHERVLALLKGAGFDEERTAAVFHAFTAWVLGYVSVELRAMVDNPDEPDPAFRLGLHRMPSNEVPTLRAITPVLAERGGPDALAAGVDAVVDRFVDGN
ncbi:MULTISPECIES: TetR/AcrR family transcriptional regulator [Streptomyces]|uniref:TetR/AcrR family transcriptional regulator C-terminal domain-containing protein n=1 Tax=Streptomyces fuscus TaxID=3048495 RepID=A0ABT7J2K2_9ACTN|nr:MULTISPECIES: TetR/AcrR family transcriptional regulator [Streptomyces]MCM1975030.1 TetR/AcrR family transcriptional regulator C-terminal domain-containing protein [Streptomyces sp. G1]MDL2078626.1 TetR/AcrR family transcriptional regulator C-terminal domain-containing protein [Streptomyces fuscus]SBT88096.1 transcriptional regulator, TetR family [Streptomyces sp. DI166]